MRSENKAACTPCAGGRSCPGWSADRPGEHLSNPKLCNHHLTQRVTPISEQQGHTISPFFRSNPCCATILELHVTVKRLILLTKKEMLYPDIIGACEHGSEIRSTPISEVIKSTSLRQKTIPFKTLTGIKAELSESRLMHSSKETAPPFAGSSLIKTPARHQTIPRLVIALRNQPAFGFADRRLFQPGVQGL